jgi:PAS domain S-box-containing protein
MPSPRNITLFLTLGIVLMVGLFAVEAFTHVLATVAYIAITGSLLWMAAQRTQMLLVTSVATLLLIVGYFFAVETGTGAQQITFLANRIMAIVVVWFAFYFTLRYRQSQADEVRQRKQLHALFSTATEGILIVNEDGKIIMANPHALSMFGYLQSELIGATIETLIPHRSVVDHVELRRAYMDKHISRPMGSGLDLSGVRKDGSEFPVEVSLSHFTTEDGKFVVAFVLDITERKKWIQRIRQLNEELESRVESRTRELKTALQQLEESNTTLQKEILERAQAEKRLRSSQELYKAIARNFPVGWIGVLDADLKYIFADGKGLMIHGFDAEKIIGKKFADLVSNSDAIEKLRCALHGEPVTFEIDCNGRTCEVNAVPFSNSHPGNEILVVVHDITSLKHTEQELVRSLEKEKELGELKSRFVTLASHEFRTPLTTILSSSFLLESYTGEKYEKEKTTHIGRIKRAVKILTEILNDFLSLGRLEEGVVKARVEDINMNEFVRELAREVESLRRGKQTLMIQHTGDPEIQSDRQLLRNIVYNLVSNAFKYSHDEDAVQVQTALEGSNLQISVTDHGLGIPLEEQRHIFRRFYRARNVTNIQGTGLGLNIVKKYVDLLSGKISFTSKPGETIFTVSVPVRVMETSK